MKLADHATDKLTISGPVRDNWKDPPRQVAPEPSAPRQVAECNDKGVLIALQRSTHAYTIIETNSLRSEDPT